MIERRSKRSQNRFGKRKNGDFASFRKLMHANESSLRLGKTKTLETGIVERMEERNKVRRELREQELDTGLRRDHRGSRKRKLLAKRNERRFSFGEQNSCRK